MLYTMFTTHKIWPQNIRMRNILIIFLTILCGFLSVMVFASDINIETDIKNVWQTIARITITSNGEYQEGMIDMSSWGIYINQSILHPWSYDGQLLGLWTDGYVIGIAREDIGIGSGSATSWYWTDDGTNIWNTNIGNVGIWTNTIVGKVHIQWDTQTELYLEEIHTGSGTNINFKNATNTRMMWWYESKFYIGLNDSSFIDILTNGYVGIGLLPKANLQVSGTFIAGYNNSVGWAYSSILWGWDNTINNSSYSSILGGESNYISEATWSVSLGTHTYNTGHMNTFIWNSDDQNFFYAAKDKSFLINVPLTAWENEVWGVGINVNNPKTALDVDGLIRTRPRYLHPDIMCTNDIQWSIAYDSSTQHFYGCNGSDRVQLDNI